MFKSCSRHKDGPLVKGLRHRLFTAVTRVRIPYGLSINCHQVAVFFVYLDKIVKNNNQIVKKTCRIEKKSNGLLYFYKIQIKIKESLWNLIKCIKK